MDRLKEFHLQACGEVIHPVQGGERTTIIEPVHTHLGPGLQGGFGGIVRATAGPPDGDRSTDLGQTREGGGLETALKNALHGQTGTIFPGQG